MEATQSWTLLVIMMIVAIHVSSIAYRSSTMISICVGVWAKEIIIVAVFTGWVMRLVVNLDICLAELIQNRS